MDADPLVIRHRLGRVRPRELRLRRILAEDRDDVAWDVLEFDIGRGKGAVVTAGTGERNPRRRRILALQVEHFWQPVGQKARPIGEGARELRDALAEEAEAVADRHTELVGIDPGQGGHDVDRGVRNQRGVMIGEDGALLLQEVQQVRHLFEVGRHVRIVAGQMHIVELDIDDMVDAVGEMALRRGEGGAAGQNGEQSRDRDEHRSPHIHPSFPH
jgi:hypothetical protein